MPDMLVKLYDLPAAFPEEVFEKQNIVIRRALAPDLVPVTRWIEKTFGAGWAGECTVAFARQPISCFIAIRDGEVIGFACHEATCRGFFGPTGVDPSCRGLGIGRRLLLECLQDMKNNGYAYAIIGGAGPVEFYEKSVGATAIAGSIPGIYRDMLKNL
ncbi:MAG TPA: GNAT family N-acetyltransferase [Clostridiales bacterium]|nr:GNAT family N-acetyltransferase [Clostridiales bacterium]